MVPLSTADDRAVRALLVRAELAARIQGFSKVDGLHATPVPRLEFIRLARARTLRLHMNLPTLWLLLQGGTHTMSLRGRHLPPSQTSWVLLPHDSTRHGATVDLALAGPCLALRAWVDLAAVMNMTGDWQDPSAGGDPVQARGVLGGPATLEVLEAALRWIRLLDKPEDIEVLAPLREKEVLYWALRVPEAARMRDGLCRTPGGTPGTGVSEKARNKRRTQ